MLKRLALAVALLGLAPAMAVAHGPSHQKVTETIEINAPADKVWAVVGNFQDMGWHPAFTKTEGTGGNDPASTTRKLTLVSGATIYEKLIKYNAEGRTHSYEIDNINWRVVPL